MKQEAGLAGRDFDRAYAGTIPAPGRWLVTVIEGCRRRKLDPRTNIINHSPTGFAWGYQGSGPAQLALAILVDAVGRERAVPLHQDFKRAKIATLDQNAPWRMTYRDVAFWVEERERGNK